MFQETRLTNDPFKDMFADVGVHGWERVVQKVDVSVVIDSSRQRHALLLATRQVDPL